MFVKNKLTKFDLSLVPQAFCEGWQRKNKCRSLEHAQSYCAEDLWSRRCFVFAVSLASLFLGRLIFKMLMPESYANDLVQWLGAITGSFLSSSGLWLLAVYVYPSPSMRAMRKFMKDYARAQKQLNGSFGYRFHRYVAERAALDTDTVFRLLPAFLEIDLWRIANSVKVCQTPGGFVIIGRGLERDRLVGQFKGIYDTWKPFGMVHDSYGSYFID